MTQHHHHDHDSHHHHDHDPDHDHHGHHPHDHESSLSFGEKLEKLTDHWIRHNTDHAKTYSEWASKAHDNGMEAVAKILNDVGILTLEMNLKFKEAAKHIAKHIKDDA